MTLKVIHEPRNCGCSGAEVHQWRTKLKIFGHLSLLWHRGSEQTQSYCLLPGRQQVVQLLVLNCGISHFSIIPPCKRRHGCDLFLEEPSSRETILQHKILDQQSPSEALVLASHIADIIYLSISVVRIHDHNPSNVQVKVLALTDLEYCLVEEGSMAA
ncbi:hypothetical protein NC651_001766 [Populus alba x Populus x berolinensis]|nr:hypothetical protein NC651_001766 [Populus alba x Populus x berolinensis]